LSDIIIIPLNKYFIYFQVRVTNLKDAADHIGEVLKRVKKEHLTRAYKIKDWYGYLSPNFVGEWY
jgi:hypothetical protein